MRITRCAAGRAVAAVVVALAVAGCGAASEPGSSTPAAASADQAAVETVFRSYHQALLARDFGTACGLNSPETSAALVRNLNERGSRAGSCEEALAAVYAQPAYAAVADRVSNSAQLRRVTVAGDTATLSWTFVDKGAPRPVDTGLRRVDGQWRLLAVGT